MTKVYIARVSGADHIYGHESDRAYQRLTTLSQEYGTPAIKEVMEEVAASLSLEVEVLYYYKQFTPTGEGGALVFTPEFVVYPMAEDFLPTDAGVVITTPFDPAGYTSFDDPTRAWLTPQRVGGADGRFIKALAVKFCWDDAQDGCQTLKQGIRPQVVDFLQRLVASNG